VIIGGAVVKSYLVDIWSKFAVVGAWGKFENPEEGKCLLLKASIRRLLNTQYIEET
jgi:hypothetical protein